MTFWIMQLHPGEAALSAQHAHESLAANFIGLDFNFDIGDLLRAKQTDLPPGQEDYWAFAHEMALGDRVLIICPPLSSRIGHGSRRVQLHSAARA